MDWIPIRKRKEYRIMRNEIDEAITLYYERECKPQYCEPICLYAYRLLKYLRREIGGISNYVPDHRVHNDATSAILDYYAVDENSSAQEESDILEILSRSAFREMKKVPDPMDDWT